jgi:branched-chain amino acid transport system substrate-binding protein
MRIPKTIIFLFILLIFLQTLVGLSIANSKSQSIKISYGEETFFKDWFNKDEEKGNGIKQIRDKDLDEAQEKFRKYLFNNGLRTEKLECQVDNKSIKMVNDPEALIYLNNATIEDEAKEKEIYTIAVAIPIPKQPDESLEILRGVAQAQNKFNCLSENNTKFFLKVAIASDNDDTEIAKKVAKKLAKEPNILGVVGHRSSSVTIEARKIYNDQKLVAITPTSSSVTLSKWEGRSDNYVFRTVTSDDLAAKELARYMLNILKKTKAAAYYTKGNYSKSLTKEFAISVKEGKGEVLGKPTKEKDELLVQPKHDLSNPYFLTSSSLNDIEAKGIDVLMFVPDDDATLTKMLLLAKNNKKRLNLLGGDVVYSQKTLQEGGDEIVGTVVAIPWHIDANRDSDFVKKSDKLWGGDISWRTALAYDATNALIEAIKKNPDRKEIRKTLISKEFKFDGASGNNVQFSENGDRINAPVQLVKIVCVDQNKCEFQPILRQKRLKDEQDQYKQSISLNPVNPDSDKLHRT